MKNKDNRESYLSNLIKDQAERIAELKKQNDALTLKIDEYAKREQEITDAIIATKKKCDEIETEIKIKYALECERLDAFRKKWTEAAKYGYLKDSIEKTERTLRECQAELEKAFADDFGINDYITERERIDDDPTLNYDAIAKRSKRKIDELSEEDLKELLSQL